MTTVQSHGAETSHRVAGMALLSVGVVFFFAGLLGLFSLKYSYFSWGAAILALIFGRYGITNLCIADSKKVPHEQTEDAQPFLSFLSTGEEVKIVMRVDLTTLGPRARDFNLQVQRTLNEYFRELDELPDNPYRTLDAVLMTALGPTAKKFGIPAFEVQTIEIRVGGQLPLTPQPTAGIWFGGRNA